MPAVRFASLRVGGAAGEAVAGWDLAARGGGACLVGPASAVGCGLRPSRDCAALLGLGARRQLTALRSVQTDAPSQTTKCAARTAPSPALLAATDVPPRQAPPPRVARYQPATASPAALLSRSEPHRTAPHRTAPHRTAPQASPKPQKMHRPRSSPKSQKKGAAPRTWCDPLRAPACGRPGSKRFSARRCRPGRRCAPRRIRSARRRWRHRPRPR